MRYLVLLAVSMMLGGALAIIYRQNSLGILLFGIGIICAGGLCAGLVGNENGEKSGLAMKYTNLPDDEEYVYYGKLCINYNYHDKTATNDEVALIRKASDEAVKGKLIAVKGFYYNDIEAGDFFTKKSEKVFVRKYNR